MQTLQLFHFCILCDKPCAELDLCDDCSASLPWATYLISPPPPGINELQPLFFMQEPINKWIHQLKYNRRLMFARLMAQLMLRELTVNPAVEAIAAIPLHPDRIRHRGFNQALEISKIITKSLEIVPLDNQLERVKNTLPQVSLKSKLRKKNMSDAFKSNLDNDLSGLILIDDVTTTGSTASSLAHCIRKENPGIYLQLWTIAHSDSG